MPPFRGVNSKSVHTSLALFPDVRSDTMPPFRGVNSKPIRTILALFPDVRSDTTHHSTHPLRFHDVKTETMPHCASYIFVVC